MSQEETQQDEKDETYLTPKLKSDNIPFKQFQMKMIQGTPAAFTIDSDNKKFILGDQPLLFKDWKLSRGKGDTSLLIEKKDVSTLPFLFVL